MAYAKCWDCGWEQDGIKTLREARQLAMLHYKSKSCLQSFGYTSKMEADNWGKRHR